MTHSWEKVTLPWANEWSNFIFWLSFILINTIVNTIKLFNKTFVNLKLCHFWNPRVVCQLVVMVLGPGYWWRVTGLLPSSRFCGSISFEVSASIDLLLKTSTSKGPRNRKPRKENYFHRVLLEIKRVISVGTQFHIPSTTLDISDSTVRRPRLENYPCLYEPFQK